jgi:hypothetical protein
MNERSGGVADVWMDECKRTPHPRLHITTIVIMADEALPSISTGVVGSRFVSQSDVEAARARREEQWKAAYARFLILHSSALLSFVLICLSHPSFTSG